MALAYQMTLLNGSLFHFGLILILSNSQFSFTYVGNDGLSHFASRSILSMASSRAARSQSNIYLDDPDYYHQQLNGPNLQTQHSVSTYNMPSLVASSTSIHPNSSARMKNATSMQQLKEPTSSRIPNRSWETAEQQNMIMDQDEQERQSTLSIPDIYRQQLINEHLMCIQQMMASGQNFASMFNDDPVFAQQFMAYLSSGDQQDDDYDVMEVTDE